MQVIQRVVLSWLELLSNQTVGFKMDLRPHFIKYLTELADKDDSIMFIVGDLGYGFAEPFIKKHPDKFLNCGIMEQSMVGIACGLALGGKKPYVYSVINFLIFRAYEQMRNDVCYGNANVKLIGVRGKESYKFLGHSHNITFEEDIMVLGHLPYLNICYPDNKIELQEDIATTYLRQCPAYIRL